MSHAYAPTWLVFESRPQGHGRHCMRGGPYGRAGRGRGPGRGFGPRVRRGDVRAAALLLLDEQPRNGYGLMQEIEERSGGLWRPSPGAVYPALAQLEDEGLIAPVEEGGKKLFALTDEGRAHVAEHREQLGTPWKVGDDLPEGMAGLGQSFAALAQAFEQVRRTGGDAQIARAREVLDEARKALYRLLAGD